MNHSTDFMEEPITITISWHDQLVFSLSQKVVAALFGVMIFLLMLLAMLPSKAAAESRITTIKTASSVQITEGDSIWSIAQQYYTPECGSFEDYMNEIIVCNQLKDDTIHSGRFLIIPYYIPVYQ